MSATVNEVSAVLKNLDKMRSMLDSKLATRFSIFSVIGELSEAEVSKILAHLLDPRGTHGQGDKYIELFLRMLSQNYKTRQNDFASYICPPEKVLAGSEPLSIAEVKTEDQTEANRRIDITIQIGEFIIGIENKLWAGEQKNQLSDYWKSLTKGSNGNNAVLVFLCVGKDRVPESIDRALSDRLKHNGTFFQINYEDDIIPWLKECIKGTESEKIRWYLEELSNWISRYCYGRDYFMSDKSVLLDIANESETVFSAMLYIQNNLDTVKAKLINGYLEYIKTCISEKLALLPNWRRQDVRDRVFTIENVQTPDVHVCIGFSAKPYNNFSYAIIAPRKNCSFYSGLKDKLSYRLEDVGCGSSDDSPLYVWYEKNLNWMSSPEFLIELYKFGKSPDTSKLKKKADEFINRMFEDIKAVDSVLQSQKQCGA